MTLFFPDVNVWLALATLGHTHNSRAWKWLEHVSPRSRILFCRFTQMGFLRLMTNSAVLGENTLTLGQAWDVYDDWLRDARVEFHVEPPSLDVAFRETTAPFADQRALKWIGDCYLLAFAKTNRAALVTFDKSLAELARQQGHTAVIPT